MSFLWVCDIKLNVLESVIFFFNIFVAKIYEKYCLDGEFVEGKNVVLLYCGVFVFDVKLKFVWRWMCVFFLYSF